MHTISPEHKEQAALSNKIWTETIEKYKEGSHRIYIADAIEMLIHDENSFINVFGQDILDISFRATIKLSESNIDKEIIKESRDICKTLIDLTRKYSFEYCKDK
jgi:5'-deoxynucleotidase YfbR-like HD superfamily hydrolase